MNFQEENAPFLLSSPSIDKKLLVEIIVTKCTDECNYENIGSSSLTPLSPSHPKIKFLVVAFSWDVDQLPWNVEEVVLYEVLRNVTLV